MSPGRVPSPSHHVLVQWLQPGRCTSLQFQRGSPQAKRLVPSQGCPGRSGRGRVQGPPTREAGTRWPPDRGRPAPPRASPGTAHSRRRPSSLEGPLRSRAFRLPLSQSPASPSAALPCLSPNGRLSPVRRSPPGPLPPPPPPPLQLPPDLARLRSAPCLPSSRLNAEGTEPVLEAPGSACADSGMFITCFSSPTRHPPAPLTRKS